MDIARSLCDASPMVAGGVSSGIDAEERQKITTAGTVRVNGEAIILTISLNGLSGSESLSCFSTHSAEINEIAKKHLKNCFSSYEIDAVNINENIVQITVYGSSMERRQFAAYGGEKWVRKADRYKYLMRKEIRALLGADGIISADLAAEWHPGHDLDLSDTAITEDTPDKDLQEQLRRLKEKRKYRLPATIFTIAGVAVPIITAIVVPEHLLGFLAGSYFGGPLLVAAGTYWRNIVGIDDEIRQVEASLELRELLPTQKRNKPIGSFR